MCAFRNDGHLSDSLDPELQCATQQGALRLPELQWTAPISAAEARAALVHADALIRDGSLGDALIELRLVEHAMPRIRDRIALRRAGLLMQLGRPADACAAYELAEQSLDRNVAAEARIATVHCMLEAGERSGETELEQIMRRYPHMGGRAELRLSLARARQGWGNTAGAVAIYRSIDLDEPQSDVASDARAALAAIAASGHPVRAYSATEQVDRAERLVLRGSIEAGRAAVSEVLALDKLPAAQAGRTHLLAARIARVEGRWDDVRTEVGAAMKLGVPAPEAQRFLPRGVLPAPDADPSTLKPEGELLLKRMLGGRALPKLPTPQLRAALGLAVRYELAEPATAALEALRTRTSTPPELRFEAAILAFGLASDESVASVLETVLATRALAVQARYHHARALERLARYQDAEADYRRVIDEDKSDTRYYAMWADLRLWAMRSEQAKSCVPAASQQAARATTTAGTLARRLAEDAIADAKRMAREASVSAAKLTSDVPAQVQSMSDDVPVLAANDARRTALLAKLEPVAQLHGEAYPWLGRAADLVALGLFEDASAEVGETYLAWRDARGELRLRSGLEAVLTGEAPARHVADNATRRARLSLTKAARSALADVADNLGDPGVSLRFMDVRGEMRPRAYAADVERAAAKYALDPNLLFAVMRVESIYHRQIVSYAGAVGLMQIMPRTGMLIARKLGVERFDVSDLLEPRTNVEFAAWYLASLLKRFDGRLPLAIAAYNGGPHNVRLWMQAGHPGMPLDAFLERIPFDQTHRYVRRVLTHYAAYRAQQNLPMTRLDVALPAQNPDTLAF